jgi:solute carrier family 25 (mitochondrial phosphate transporter), member 3
MAKFYFFEKIAQLFYTHVFTEPKETYSKTTQLGVTFASGYLAGVVCAIVSHPADSLVSQLGKAGNKGKSLGTIANEVGFTTLATRGLGTRVIMIGGHNIMLICFFRTYLTCCVLGTLTGFQWWIYDSFKSVMGLGTTGGK